MKKKMKVHPYLTGWAALAAVLVMALGACEIAPAGPVEPGPTPAVQSPPPAETAAPAPTPAAVELSPTLAPTFPLDDLQATVTAGLAPTPTPDPSGYSGPSLEGISVISLTNTAGDRPLWAAFSYGMRSFDPLQNHFVAIYSRDESGWLELDRQELGDVDYLDPAAVEQVQLAPEYVWLQAPGAVGAHGGTFDLLQFDGQNLSVAVSGTSASGGGNRLQDLNGDGMPEVLLDATDYYVFCFACGARFIQYQVYRWDGSRLNPLDLALLPETAPARLREQNNRAVALAQARLLQQARDQIEQAQALDGQDSTVAWNAALINLLWQEQQEQAQQGPYPLLESVFYGNYDHALQVMRAYSPEEIFSQPTPLIAGTVAEGWQESVSDWLLDLAGRAIKVEPELAPAYFLRGWGRFLADPNSPEVLADVQRAAELAPGDSLFSQSLEYLRQGR